MFSMSSESILFPEHPWVLTQVPSLPQAFIYVGAYHSVCLFICASMHLSNNY